MSLVDLGKSLLEAAKRGDTDEVRTLMSNGAPFTTDWVMTVNILLKMFDSVILRDQTSRYVATLHKCSKLLCVFTVRDIAIAFCCTVWSFDNSRGFTSCWH